MAGKRPLPWQRPFSLPGELWGPCRKGRASERLGTRKTPLHNDVSKSIWGLTTSNFFTDVPARKPLAVLCRSSLDQSTRPTIQQTHRSFPSQGIPIPSSCDFPWTLPRTRRTRLAWSLKLLICFCPSARGPPCLSVTRSLFNIYSSHLLSMN